ncbi:LysR family transcriptional regulator [Novosphingobium mangrovi (ex Hu et al. 2023)]|uniref:LysR substrate-binding domain-containing protein n=1 Tax=Novosphingobium mangrovi (ex Hu et al. 2023) TaxID=2930094 RepID=A0ABT0AEI3_9SPHN|nr:LysR family transcriptional regulator [Novosphingobium mangrovi (ex Hu et al. 2023)]MCJ1961589.1 LysR substrate-binding domain-containing protein [Novosphingobium mangrovi (ex Hu et al. 2023)]
MDDLLKIRAFLDVVEDGSFSAAARRQAVSTSSIARRVAALEDELGVRLINRNTRSLSITQAGEVYYRKSRAALRDLEEARSEVLSFQEDVKGILRVSLRISAGAVVLPRLKDFLESYPDLTIDLTLTDERPDLLKNSIDVAVWVGELKDSELIARRLDPGKRLLCASPAYLDKAGRPTHPDDLEQHECLVYHAPDYDGRWTFVKDEETHEINGTGAFRSSSGPALMAAAVAGMGLVVLQKYMVQGELASGALEVVLEDYAVGLSGTDAGIYAIYPHSRHLPTKTRAFIDFLLTCFAEQKG